MFAASLPPQEVLRVGAWGAQSRTRTHPLFDPSALTISDLIHDDDEPMDACDSDTEDELVTVNTSATRATPVRVQHMHPRHIQTRDGPRRGCPVAYGPDKPCPELSVAQSNAPAKVEGVSGSAGGETMSTRSRPGISSRRAGLHQTEPRR